MICELRQSVFYSEVSNDSKLYTWRGRVWYAVKWENLEHYHDRENLPPPSTSKNQAPISSMLYEPIIQTYKTYVVLMRNFLLQGHYFVQINLVPLESNLDPHIRKLYLDHERIKCFIWVPDVISMALNWKLQHMVDSETLDIISVCCSHITAH